MSRVQIALDHIENGMATAVDAEILRQEISTRQVKLVALNDEYSELHRAARDVCALKHSDEFEAALMRMARLIEYPGY